MSECLLCEVTVNYKKGYIAVLYRPPSQNNTVFNDFLSNFEKLLQELSALNPDFSIILGDFNARSKSRCKSYINTIEGTKIDSVTTSYGLQQLITQPTHLLANSSSCIDLIFTDQPSLIVDCGIHPSLHPNCHHQIVYCKLDLNIFCPPPYRPVSLLPICGKIFKRIIFNNVFLFLEDNNLLLINQVLDLMIHVSISFCQLCTVFIQILIIIHHLKLEVIFLTFPKPLVNFGMMVFYINLKVLGFLEIN